MKRRNFCIGAICLAMISSLWTMPVVYSATPSKASSASQTYTKPVPVVRASSKKVGDSAKSTTGTSNKVPTKQNNTKGNSPKGSSSHASESNPKSGEPVIRVLLSAGTQPFTVTSQESMVILNGQNKQIMSVPAHTSMTIQVKQAYIEVNGKKVDKEIKIQNTKGRYSSELGVFNRIYRGGLTVRSVNASAMQVINVLGLEQYLRGVVPEEAVPSWPKAALEAQAVAARTYALYGMEKTKNEAYDIGTTTAHQVYKGKSSELPSTNAAVRSTHGMIITYQGNPINALFHSDGGGYTEDSVNVWGNALPYLKGVSDLSNHEGTSVWNVVTSRQSMEEKLAKAGKSPGSLQKIELSTLKKRPMNALDRGVSGRVKSMKFIGSKGTVQLTGEEVQALFGLKSTLFDFYIGQTPPKHVDSLRTNPNRNFGKGNVTVTIHGYGWGHGLGLSQWGAYEMAKKKEGAQVEYYKTILSHYYQGTQIVPHYT